MKRRDFIKAGALFVPAYLTGVSGILRAQTAPSLKVNGTSRIGAVNRPTVVPCDLSAGDILNESFENTGSPGYDLTWTETNDPDENASIPNNFCTGLGSQCLRSNVTTSTSYALHNTGAGTTSTRYFRVFVYLDSTNMVVDNNVHIIHCQSSGGTRAFTIRWTNVTGQGYGFDMIGTTFSTNIGSAQLDTWYRVEVKWVNNATGLTELKVFNATTLSQLGNTVTVDTGNVSLQHMVLGVFNNPASKAYDFYFDGFGVDSVGYLGQ